MDAGFTRRLRSNSYQIAGIAVVSGSLIAAYLRSVLLFHSLAELIGVSISFGIFAVVWNTRSHFRHHSINMLGVAFLFFGLLTLLHVLTYPGTDPVPVANSDLTTQFGISSRFLFAVSIFFAVFYHERPLSDSAVFSASLSVSIVILLLILTGHFPICYVEGRGLTPFARFAGYAIVGISALALWPVIRSWKSFEPGTPWLLSASFALFAISGFISTTYDNLYDWRFFLANSLKLASLYLLYRALAYKRLLVPYERMRTEIENRLTAEQQLKNSEEKFHSIFENAGSMIFVVDNGLAIADCNAICFEKVGYRKEELRGKNFADLIRLDSKQPLSLSDVALRVDESRGNLEASMIKSDSSTLPVSITSSFRRFASDGQELTPLVVVDLTEHRRLEEQFLQSQKLESIGRLSGGVAHDFNNMATVLQGYSEMILNTYGNDTTLSTWARAILDATLRSAKLSQQLLAFSRKSVFNPTDVDLNLVIKDLQKMMRRLLRDDIELSVNTGTEPAMVRVDKNRIEQVIINLVINARDAMSNGGRLDIETRNVELSEEETRELPGDAQPGPHVMISVADSGTGIDPAILKSIFEPFFTTKPVNSGSGLGLSMVFGTVTQSGGAIQVESELGNGSRFTLYLPRLPVAASLRESPTQEPTGPRGSETILVVEDDEMIMDVVKQILPALGYELLTATNAAQAIEHVRANADRRIDLIVTDVVMAGMSGPEMLTVLQKQIPQTKVLYISGYAFNEISHHHGVLDPEVNYLQKPFSGIELARKIRKVIDSQR